MWPCNISVCVDGWALHAHTPPSFRVHTKSSGCSAGGALRRTVIIAQTATDDYLSFPQSETDFANLVFTGSSALAAIGSYHVLTFDRFEQIDNNNNNSSDHMQHAF